MTPEDLRPRVRPGALGAGWEGWFVIGIGARGSAVPWVKTHVFRQVARRGLHPFAAVEGLLAPGEVVTHVATRDRIETRRTEIAPTAIEAAFAPFRLAAADARIEGDPPAVRFAADRVELSLALDLGDTITWIRLRRVLTYVGASGRASGSVAARPWSGLGVLEHAWGANVPFDPRPATGAWHWDVLAFEEGGLAGALWLSWPIVGRRGARSAARLPGGAFTPMRPGRLELLDGDRRCPRRWAAALTDERGGELAYEAVATTPQAAVCPGGGFVGFDFAATWRPAGGGATRRLEGTGFSECGGRS